jgi:myo-inositol 2-dehydrogenase/D-chiro-inositol 1-dehydrogenase
MTVVSERGETAASPQTAAAIGIGVIGTGRIGSMHVDLIATRVPGADVALVYDAVPEAAARTGAPVARSVEELLASPAVDAVAICSKTDTHVDLILAAADAGKAIFCEKPISLDLGEVDRALAAVEKAGVLFQVGFNRRFDPGHRSIRDAVASGAVGNVHLIRISSRDPAPPPLDYIRSSGGIFLDMTIHDFDMARFVSGSEVVEVFARGAVRVDSAIGEAGDIDTAVVTLVHEDGALTVIDNSRKAVYGYDQRVEAFGSAGVASSENPTAHGGVLRTAAGTQSSLLPFSFLERYIPSYVAEWEAFVDALRTGAPSPVPGADGRAPLAIGLAAARSVREGCPVRVDEIG